jgi:hypothetical protein
MHFSTFRRVCQSIPARDFLVLRSKSYDTLGFFRGECQVACDLGIVAASDQTRQSDHRRSQQEHGPCLRSMGRRPILLKPAISLVTKQQRKDLSRKI